MVSQSKRGQAALEFLTTYGWAFLVILIVIGALAYFGVLNPQQFVPERCTMSQEFSCEDYVLIKDTSGSPETLTVNVFLRNNLGNTATVNNITLTSLEALDGSDNAATVDCTAVGDAQLSASGTAEFTCVFEEGADYDNDRGGFPAEGSKTQIDVLVSYREVGGRYDHSVQGQIFGTIQ